MKFSDTQITHDSLNIGLGLLAMNQVHTSSHVQNAWAVRGLTADIHVHCTVRSTVSIWSKCIISCISSFPISWAAPRLYIIHFLWLLIFRRWIIMFPYLFSIQIAVSVSTTIIWPPEAKLRMKVPIERHVELFCDLPLEGFLAPVAYNLTLIIMSAAFGFLTRKLPENFNESWYIFISVCTTTFLWLVFLPSYFSTFYAYHQAALLAFCLLVNAVITLLCLYVPKIFAVYFVGEEKMTFLFDESSASTAYPSNIELSEI